MSIQRCHFPLAGGHRSRLISGKKSASAPARMVAPGNLGSGRSGQPAPAAANPRLQRRRRLRARDLGQVRQPLRDRSRVVVHHVVQARRAAADRRDRRGRRVGDLDERPDPGPAADHRHLPLPHHVHQEIRGARPVQAAVAQHDALRRRQRHGLVHVRDRRRSLHRRPDRPQVGRVCLGLQRTAGTLVRRGARIALRDDRAGARPRRGRQQVIGAPRPQLVGDRERLVGMAQAPHARQRGHLVHDHPRRRGPHRRDHRLAI